MDLHFAVGEAKNALNAKDYARAKAAVAEGKAVNARYKPLLDLEAELEKGARESAQNEAGALNRRATRREPYGVRKGGQFGRRFANPCANDSSLSNEGEIPRRALEGFDFSSFVLRDSAASGQADCSRKNGQFHKLQHHVFLQN